MSAVFATKMVSSLMSLLAWAGFYLLRFVERLFSPGVMSLLLWPPAAAWDLLHVYWRKPVESWRRFPESWNPNPVRFFLRQGLGLFHPRLVYLWPDRLCNPRWLSRCRLEGRYDLLKPRDGDRGVVLASVHIGPSEIMPYWLRAHGIVTTTVRSLPSLQRLASHQWALSPPSDVPLFLPVNEMPRVRQLLGPGRRLLVMVDVNRGKQVYVPFENHLFRMATGAIRLAALAGAELVPCLIRETDSWKFVIHFGNPVPQSHLGSSPDLEGAAAHLLEEFLKVIPSYPEQSNHRLLSAISVAAEDGVPNVPAIVHGAENR